MRTFAILIIVSLLGLSESSAQHSYIRDFTFKQDANSIAVAYELIENPRNTYYEVELYCLTSDAEFKIKNATGDIGQVSRGGKKHIDWNVLEVTTIKELKGEIKLRLKVDLYANEGQLSPSIQLIHPSKDSFVTTDEEVTLSAQIKNATTVQLWEWDELVEANVALDNGFLKRTFSLGQDEQRILKIVASNGIDQVTKRMVIERQAVPTSQRPKSLAPVIAEKGNVKNIKLRLMMPCDRSTMTEESKTQLESILNNLESEVLQVKVIGNAESWAFCRKISSQYRNRVAMNRAQSVVNFIEAKGLDRTNILVSTYMGNKGNINIGMESVVVEIQTEIKDCKIPTAFTPNNDNKNDKLVISCIEHYENARLLIYNVGGEQVYKSDNYRNDWDGTQNGKPLSAGLYICVLTLPNGKKLTEKISIMR
ncbi:MAG: T9SS type B sorting domain-containing protein [Aureispira sp.]|nr:T9SS type B sorting domain-containing protein [Aureispira sp.]